MNPGINEAGLWADLFPEANGLMRDVSGQSRGDPTCRRVLVLIRASVLFSLS